LAFAAKVYTQPKSAFFRSAGTYYVDSDIETGGSGSSMNQGRELMRAPYFFKGKKIMSEMIHLHNAYDFPHQERSSENTKKHQNS